MASRSVSPAGHRCLVAAVGAFIVFMLSAPLARADHEEGEGGRGGGGVDLGFDLEGAAVLNPPVAPGGSSLSGGRGFKVRVGDQIHLPLLRLTPEVGYAFDHLFASNDVGTSYAWDTHRVFAGARLGLGEILVPTLYGHVGYGWRLNDDPTVGEGSGMAFDAGFALDLHLLPILGFGAHIEYAMIDSTPYTPHWLALGLHADLAF